MCGFFWWSSLVWQVIYPKFSPNPCRMNLLKLKHFQARKWDFWRNMQKLINPLGEQFRNAKRNISTNFHNFSMQGKIDMNLIRFTLLWNLFNKFLCFIQMWMHHGEVLYKRSRTEFIWHFSELYTNYYNWISGN